MERSVAAKSGSSLVQTRQPGNMLMLITHDRVAYVGLLGKPRTREFGSITVYVSLSAPFQIQVGKDDWESAEFYVVAPDTPHRITTSDRLIGVIMIEPETVHMACLPDWLQPRARAAQPLPAPASVRNAFDLLRRAEVDTGFIRENFDPYFFGEQLAPRRLDSRMAMIVERINQDPCTPFGADDCARDVNLSFSRFLHLFKEDVGTTFRCFRAWKRARSFLHHVHTAASLTDIALDIGYPDSSHFSHTVRRYWGLTPKDILAGSRDLAVIIHKRSGTPAA